MRYHTKSFKQAQFLHSTKYTHRGKDPGFNNFKYKFEKFAVKRS